MASALDLFPGQTGRRVAKLAGLLWRVLQPVAGGAVLQDEPPLIDGVPEGLAQRVGDGDQLRHRFIPVSLSFAFTSPPWPGLTRPSTSLIRFVNEDVGARLKAGQGVLFRMGIVSLP